MIDLIEKMKNNIHVICMLILVLLIVNILIFKATPSKEIRPDPVQYYGQIVSIQVENNYKIIRVKGASTPYPQHDNYLEGEVELIAPENIAIGMRLGPGNEKTKLNSGDLSKMYDSLSEGDCISFRFKTLVFESRKEIEQVIFTGN